MRFILSCVVLVLIGCSKAPEPVEPIQEAPKKVDNPVTRYTDNLASNLDKANAAADKMNKALQQQQSQLDRFRELE